MMGAPDLGNLGPSKQGASHTPAPLELCSGRWHTKMLETGQVLSHPVMVHAAISDYAERLGIVDKVTHARHA